MTLIEKLDLAQSLTVLFAMGFKVPYSYPESHPRNHAIERWADRDIAALKKKQRPRPVRHKTYLELLKEDAERRGIPFKKPNRFYYEIN